MEFNLFEVFGGQGFG
ncbi:hypothetical protein [Mycobacterium sp.]